MATSSSHPRVSVCVPNLNNRRFLPERFRTILNQSWTDWELLVYDSYSDDGAWEYICQVAAAEPRMRIWQGPREGTPGSWNPCVRAARGDYVYIATSDDTMPSNCLERLVAALDSHPECDLAHCPLQPIDEKGQPLAEVIAWWEAATFSQSSGPMIDRSHLRMAPFDGILHLQGGSVYISITQLLIRRSLFDRIGLFESKWGSVGDFNWSMRAGLVANTIHVPTTWGGWRLHGSQATTGANFGSEQHARRIDDMIDGAINACRPFLVPTVHDRLAQNWAPRAKALRSFERDVASRQHSIFGRRVYLLRQLLRGSPFAREYVESRLKRRTYADRVKSWLGEAGLTGPFLVPITDQFIH